MGANREKYILEKYVTWYNSCFIESLSSAAEVTQGEPDRERFMETHTPYLFYDLLLLTFECHGTAASITILNRSH